MARLSRFLARKLINLLLQHGDLEHHLGRQLEGPAGHQWDVQSGEPSALEQEVCHDVQLCLPLDTRLPALPAGPTNVLLAPSGDPSTWHLTLRRPARRRSPHSSTLSGASAACRPLLLWTAALLLLRHFRRNKRWKRYGASSNWETTSSRLATAAFGLVSFVAIWLTSRKTCWLTSRKTCWLASWQDWWQDWWLVLEWLDEYMKGVYQLALFLTLLSVLPVALSCWQNLDLQWARQQSPSTNHSVTYSLKLFSNHLSNSSLEPSLLLSCAATLWLAYADLPFLHALLSNNLVQHLQSSFLACCLYAKLFPPPPTPTATPATSAAPFTPKPSKHLANPAIIQRMSTLAQEAKKRVEQRKKEGNLSRSFSVSTFSPDKYNETANIPQSAPPKTLSPGRTPVSAPSSPFLIYEHESPARKIFSPAPTLTSLPEQSDMKSADLPNSTNLPIPSNLPTCPNPPNSNHQLSPPDYLRRAIYTMRRNRSDDVTRLPESLDSLRASLRSLTPSPQSIARSESNDNDKPMEYSTIRQSHFIPKLYFAQPMEFGRSGLDPPSWPSSPSSPSSPTSPSSPISQDECLASSNPQSASTPVWDECD